jgi:metal-responsive CopG/Arc/MetJ family transcriptional regulator
MSTEMVRLNITLPSSITEELDQFAAPRKRSQFIAEAIKLRIKQLKDKKIEAQLAEGYLAAKNEELEITKEYEAIDIESWDEY